MGDEPARSLTETLAFKEVGQNKWETVLPPQRMGNALNIAYGGFGLAVAAQAACLSVPDGYHMYTITGNFLGPASTDRPMQVSTKPLRQTRTFATCQVEVSQIQDKGDLRPCLIALADFQVPEKASLLEYSASPKTQYTHHSSLSNSKQHTEGLAQDGKITRAQADSFNSSFTLINSLFDVRPCPEGVFAQNLQGFAKKLPTTQDGLPLAEKTTGDWMRCRSELPTPTANTMGLAFFMDAALSFAPLAFDHKYLEDSGACSSLDFALRVFSNSIDLEKWHLREMMTHAGGEGRTYGEGRLWNEEGKCVASMTQQSILRPRKGKL